MIKGELTPSKNAVDEVDEVEKQLAHIRDLIAKAEVSDEPKDTKDSKENKEGEKNPGSMDDKEKKNNDSSTTVRRNSLEEVQVPTLGSCTVVIVVIINPDYYRELLSLASSYFEIFYMYAGSSYQLWLNCSTQRSSKDYPS